MKRLGKSANSVKIVDGIRSWQTIQTPKWVLMIFFYSREKQIDRKLVIYVRHAQAV